MADLVEDLPDHLETIDLLNIINFTGQILVRHLLNFVSLLGRVGIVIDTTAVRQCVVHGKLLLEVSNFLLEALDLQRRVHDRVHHCLVLDLHHTRRKLQCRNGLFNVLLGAVHVGDHDGLAVTSERVTQQIRQGGLSIGYVIALLIGQSKDNLLKITETLVDMLRLLKKLTASVRLLGALRTGKINKMELGVDNLLGGFNARSGFNMQRVDAMGARRMEVEHVSAVRSVRLTLKQLLKSIFLGIALMHRKVLDCDTAARIILNAQSLGVVTDVLRRSQQINHLKNEYMNAI